MYQLFYTFNLVFIMWFLQGFSVFAFLVLGFYCGQDELKE